LWLAARRGRAHHHRAARRLLHRRATSNPHPSRNNPLQNAQNLLEQIQALPPERIAEIEDFVAFIAAREEARSLTRAAAASAPAFAVIWDNPDDDAYDEL